jgi:hypothetical protein
MPADNPLHWREKAMAFRAEAARQTGPASATLLKRADEFDRVAAALAELSSPDRATRRPIRGPALIDTHWSKVALAAAFAGVVVIVFCSLPYRTMDDGMSRIATTEESGSEVRGNPLARSDSGGSELSNVDHGEDVTGTPDTLKTAGLQSTQMHDPPPLSDITEASTMVKAGAAPDDAPAGVTADPDPHPAHPIATSPVEVRPRSAAPQGVSSPAAEPKQPASPSRPTGTARANPASPPNGCVPYTAPQSLTGLGGPVEGLACPRNGGGWRLVSERSADSNLFVTHP